jgi:hypothetical protein
MNHIQPDDPNLENSSEKPRFCEESRTPLTDRDRVHFLKMLSDPPEANAALRRAARQLEQLDNQVD